MTTIDETRARFASLSVDEPATYSRDNDRFISDVVRSKLFNDKEAKDRLSRNEVEERTHRPQYATRGSGVGTGAFAGLTVPQYLVQDAALSVQSGRPLAEAINNQPLPDTGMSVNISRITTASTAALQSTELSAASFTDMDDTLLTLPVQTIAGEALLSRQLFDRAPAAMSVIMQDLTVSYNAALDNTLINQATTGLSAVAQNVDYADTTPTALELYPKVVKAAALSQRALLGRGRPDLCVMRSDLYYFIMESEGSTWPSFKSPDPRNAGKDYGSGWVGTLPCGLEVILDDSITVSGTADSGTSESEIYVGFSREGWLFENPDAPMFLTANQITAGNAEITLVMYSYAAYSFSRFANGWSKVTGSGLSGDTL